MKLLYLMVKKLQKHSNLNIRLLCSIVKKLSLPENADPAKLELEKCKDHPCITSIKNKMTSMDNPKFSFRFVSLNETLDGVNKLNPKKALQATDIPVKIIKENKNVVSYCGNKGEWFLSNFDDISSGVLQGSILGPSLFNIYICDLFFGIGDLDIANYAHDNKPYTFSSERDVEVKKLRSCTIKIFEWFHNNRLK